MTYWFAYRIDSEFVIQAGQEYVVEHEDGRQVCVHDPAIEEYYTLLQSQENARDMAGALNESDIEANSYPIELL